MEAAMITIYSWTLNNTEVSGRGTRQSRVMGDLHGPYSDINLAVYW